MYHIRAELRRQARSQGAYSSANEPSGRLSGVRWVKSSRRVGSASAAKPSRSGVGSRSQMLTTKLYRPIPLRSQLSSHFECAIAPSPLLCNVDVTRDHSRLVMPEWLKSYQISSFYCVYRRRQTDALARGRRSRKLTSFCSQGRLPAAVFQKQSSCYAIFQRKRSRGNSMAKE